MRTPNIPLFAIIIVGLGAPFFPSLVACKSGSSGSSSGTDGPSLSGITPATVFPNRTAEVTITGAGTTFSGSPTVDFRDANMKVKGVVVKNPTSLTATVEIGDGATLGPHDVIVSSAGSSNVTLIGGITLAAPIKHGRAGSVQPGGVLEFELWNADKDNPFVGAAPALVSGGVIVDYKEVSALRVVGTAVVDALAPSGALVLRLSAKNAKGETITYATHVQDPLAPQVAAAPPAVALTTGTPSAPEALTTTRQSKLYKIGIPDDGHIVYLSFGAVGEGLRSDNSTRLVGAMAPATGKFGEGFVFDTTYEKTTGSRVALGVVPKGDAFFAVHTSDLTGAAAGYGYTVRPTIVKGVGFSTKEPASPDNATAPIATVSLDGPVFSTDGAIDAPGDADYIAFTAKKTGRVFIQATSSPTKGGCAPLNLSLFTNNCSTFVSGGMGAGAGVLEATANTTYCARIDGVTPLAMGYSLVLSPELL